MKSGHSYGAHCPSLNGGELARNHFVSGGVNESPKDGARLANRWASTRTISWTDWPQGSAEPAGCPTPRSTTISSMSARGGEYDERNPRYSRRLCIISIRCYPLRSRAVEYAPPNRNRMDLGTIYLDVNMDPTKYLICYDLKHGSSRGGCMSYVRVFSHRTTL